MGPLTEGPDIEVEHGICNIWKPEARKIFDYWFGNFPLPNETSQKVSITAKFEPKRNVSTSEITDGIEFLNKKCPHNDECHPECQNGICIGPTEFDCISCNNFNDTTYLETDQQIIFRSTVEFEKHISPQHVLIRNPRQPKCVAKCPSTMVYEDKAGAATDLKCY